jgi:hypothetical protein
MDRKTIFRIRTPGSLHKVRPEFQGMPMKISSAERDKPPEKGINVTVPTRIVTDETFRQKP